MSEVSRQSFLRSTSFTHAKGIRGLASGWQTCQTTEQTLVSPSFALSFSLLSLSVCHFPPRYEKPIFTGPTTKAISVPSPDKIAQKWQHSSSRLWQLHPLKHKMALVCRSDQTLCPPNI